MLPGCPPFGISRSGSPRREQLRYFPPPTPLNRPRHQNIQQGTLGAHPAPSRPLEPAASRWERVEEVRVQKESLQERLRGYIKKTSLAILRLFLTFNIWMKDISWRLSTVIFEESVSADSLMAKG